MSDVLSVGMIGAGGIARSHMNAIAQNDNIRVAGVMDIDAGRAGSAAGAHGARAYTDLDALLAEKAIEGFVANEGRSRELAERNPILVTALNPVIGYEKGAAVAKRAYAEGRRVKEVAAEDTDLSSEDLDRLLDPRAMTEGGIAE